MKPIGIVALGCLATVAAYLGYKYVTADPSGYCHAQARYIPDAEFIRAADALLAWDMASYYIDKNGQKTDDTEMESKKWYKNWAEIHRNPSCCEVNRFLTKSTFNRMFGLQEVIVHFFPHPELGRGDSFISVYFDVCGTLIPNDFGLYIDAGESISTVNYHKVLGARNN